MNSKALSALLLIVAVASLVNNAQALITLAQLAVEHNDLVLIATLIFKGSIPTTFSVRSLFNQ